MANEFESDVIRYLRQKTDSGYEGLTFLGAEQRYVNALRNSGVNNLEEQYLLGTDTYTEIYTDADGNEITEKSFHVNSDDPSFVYNNYYKLVITDYKTPEGHGKFYFDGDTFIMPDDPSLVAFGDGSVSYPSLVTLYGVDDTIIDFTFDGAFRIYDSDFIAIRKEELLFVTDGGSTEKPVLTKTVSKSYTKDGTRVVYREDIKNYLVS